MRRFTPYSSTASGPPSLTREGFYKPSFSATDGGSFCDRYNLGPPRTSVPTRRKDNRQKRGGDPYDLGSSGRRPLPARYISFFRRRTNVRRHPSKAFPYGEGGPLAVDEVIGIMFYLFPLFRQTSLRKLRSSGTFSKEEGSRKPRFWATDRCLFCNQKAPLSRCFCRII